MLASCTVNDFGQSNQSPGTSLCLCLCLCARGRFPLPAAVVAAPHQCTNGLPSSCLPCRLSNVEVQMSCLPARLSNVAVHIVALSLPSSRPSGFWSAEAKSVNKIKVPARVCCCRSSPQLNSPRVPPVRGVSTGRHLGLAASLCVLRVCDL